MLTISPAFIFVLATIHSALALTATSWGKERIDVFGLYQGSGAPRYWHKYYTSQGGWEPHDTKFENLADHPILAHAFSQDVSSVSWGSNHLDFFATVAGLLSHTYWNPQDKEWKGWHLLAFDGFETYLRGAPATASWGPGRIDVVSRDKGRKYLHLYYNDDDENRWTGWEDPWNSPHDFETDPVIIAPDKDHFDIFGRLANGTILHLYWNGEKYSNWDHLDWKAPEIGWDGSSSLSASTWKNGSWDLWALDNDGSLWHTFWRGPPTNQFFPWENLSDGISFDATPKAVHWSAEHTDIFGMSFGVYYHKYWADGWTEWKVLGEKEFASPPEVVSWGEGHWAVFGIDADAKLWVAMYADGWRDWEELGDTIPAEELREQQSASFQQTILEGYKQGL